MTDLSTFPTIPELPKLPDVKWMACPVFHGVRIVGTGRNRAAGVFEVSLTGSGTAYVSTHAHVNDDLPAVTVRKRDYLVSLHLSRDPESGEWAEAPYAGARAVSCRKDFSGRPVAPTIRASIVDIAREAATSVWTAERDQAAHIARVTQRLISELHSYETIRKELNDVVDPIEAHVAILSDAKRQQS